MTTDDSLTRRLAEAFVQHDPLEPWLSESHWDDSYWDGEASLLADRLTQGMTVDEVRAALLDVLGQAFPGSVVGGGALRRDNIEALAEASWVALRSCTPSDDAGSTQPR